MEKLLHIASNAEVKRKSIKRISIVDQVCDSIRKDIVNGTLAAGDKLPSESEFAEIFGVNRLSVRMALQKLSTLGLIETRVGEGSFVCEFSLKSVLSEIAVFYESEDRYKDVTQLRNLLEYECMQLAINSATEDEKESLKNALNIYNECAEIYNKDLNNMEALKRVAASDFNFHYTIVSMSHNQIYKDLYYMVQQLIKEHIIRLYSERSMQRKQAGLSPFGKNDVHEKLVNAIINKNSDKLREIMDEHLWIIGD